MACVENRKQARKKEEENERKVHKGTLTHFFTLGDYLSIVSSDE
jgi:hypothetical protein